MRTSTEKSPSLDCIAASDMMRHRVVSNLTERFRGVPMALVVRSMAFAASPGDLFDILSTVPPLPVVWDDESRRWASTALIP